MSGGGIDPRAAIKENRHTMPIAPCYIRAMPPQRSQRHHFIPIYFSQAFTRSDGFFWRYDKQKDDLLKIHPERKYNPYEQSHPKNVFFVNDANTSVLRGEITDIAEKRFGIVDSHLSKALALHRDLPIGYVYSDEELRKLDKTVLEHIAMFTFRHPKRSRLYQHIFQETEFEFYWESGSKDGLPDSATMKQDETFQKVNRALMPFELLRHIVTEEREHLPRSVWHRMYQSSTPTLVLSDDPVVFIDGLDSGRDLFGRTMFPLDSRRLVVRDNQPNQGNASAVMYAYNLLAIQQASSHVCSTDRDYLIALVKEWKKLPQLPYHEWRASFYAEALIQPERT